MARQDSRLKGYYNLLCPICKRGRAKLVCRPQETPTASFQFSKMAQPIGIPSRRELFDAQTHVLNHALSFVNSMSLKCTVQLGIPEIIHRHGKPMMLSELTDALSINKAKSGCFERLMSIMIHSKFFTRAKISEEDDEEGYWLTPASYLLLRDQASSMTSLVSLCLNPTLMDPWHRLSEWYKNDSPASFETAHGRTLWEFLRLDPVLNGVFNECMESNSRFVGSVLTQDCRHVFQGLKSMVDVGGRTGTVARAIVDAFPGLKCIVLDLPHVVVGLEGSTNLTFESGDMFESIPPADAVFLKWIMHDWPDEECLTILKKCKEAIPSKEKGGKVIIVDMVVDHQMEHEAVQNQLFFDMVMMVNVSGRERSEKDWEKLFRAAGFTSYMITRQIFGLQSLIELFP